MRTLIISLFILSMNTVKAQELFIPQNIRYLALGDSYTIGESVSYQERWPSQLSDSLAARNYLIDTVHYIATTGWTTQNLLNGIHNQNLESKNFNLVSVLIGVNNQYQNKPFGLFLTQFPQLLDSAIRYAGGDTSSVFVLSIPDYAYTPFGQASNPNQTSQEIDQYNAAKDSICQIYGIKYFNITPISRQGLNQTSLVAPDGLHPSGEQYGLWVQEVLNCVDTVRINALNSVAYETAEVYPNPVGAQIFVKDFQKIASYAIYDLNGRMLEEKVLLSSQINVEHLSNGAYLLNLRVKDGTVQNLRIVIEK
jgi:lysophospholipase L1-like esterase